MHDTQKYERKTQENKHQGLNLCCVNDGMLSMTFSSFPEHSNEAGQREKMHDTKTSQEKNGCKKIKRKCFSLSSVKIARWARPSQLFSNLQTKLGSRKKIAWHWNVTTEKRLRENQAQMLQFLKCEEGTLSNTFSTFLESSNEAGQREKNAWHWSVTREKRLRENPRG